MAAELLVATRSGHKLAEIRAIIAPAARVDLVSLSELGIAHSAAEDDIELHSTFLANAVAKARYFAELTGRRTLADDSGIVVAALGGAPGVRTKRFAIDRGYAPAGTAGSDLDVANNELLVALLADTPDERRGAHYVCAAALAEPARVSATAIGTCRGVVARTPKGSGGFGYDPLFVIPDLGITFAELAPEDKNRRSHRARAVRALTPLLTADLR